MRIELEEETSEEVKEYDEHRERIEDWAAHRKEHMKELPFWERVRWYVSYHWIQAVAVILIVAFVGRLVWSYTFGKTENWLGGIIINSQVEDSALDQVEEAFAKTQKLDTKKQLVTLDAGYYLSNDSDTMNQNDMNYLTKFEANISIGAVDVMIASSETYDYLGGRCTYQDLTELLSGEFLAQFDESQLYYGKDSDGKVVLSGISIQDTDFLKETSMLIEDPYISVPISTSNPEHAAAFIEYLFEQ